MLRRLILTVPVLALLGLFFACSGASSKNPGGHSSEEIARIEKQPPPAAPVTSAPASAAATGGSNNGGQLFAQYCMPCHREGKNGPPLNGVFARAELPSGTPANDERVKQTIKMGRAMMPAFSGVLNDDQVNAIVNYLHTI